MLGMLMQRFEFVDHANYQLKIKESLTLKPDGLTITIRPRAGRTWGASPRAVAAAATPAHPRAGGRRPPTGTAPRCWCSSARTSARRRTSPHGSPARPPTAATPPAPPGSTTRSASCRPRAPSWSSPPPTTASRRTTRRSSPRGSTTPRPRRRGVRYTVFGCGNRDWAATYQAVPTRVDAALEARGATRVYPRGEGDARGDFDGQFEAWYAGLWDALGSALGLDAGATAAAGAARGWPSSWSSAARQPDPAVLPRPGGDRAGQPRAHRPCGHPGRPLGAPHRDRAAARRPTPRATTSGCCRATRSP